MKRIEFDGSAEELSFQQKLWLGTSTFFYSVRPVILYLFLPAILICIGMLLPGDRTAEDMVSGSGNFYHTMGILLTIWLLHKRSQKRGSSLREDVTLEYQDTDRKKLLYLFGTGLGFGFFFSSVITVVPFPEFLMESYRSSSNGLNNGTDPVLALLSTTLLAPAAEEIIFRGYMLNRLLGWFKERDSILIVSALFALCHVSVLWILYAFAMGILLTKVSMKEDNILYSIVLHIGFNMNVLPIWVINRLPAVKAVVFADNLFIAIYGVTAGLFAVWLFGKYRKETKLW